MSVGLASSLEIGSFLPEHFDQWLPLAQGYKTFYETGLPDEAYAHTWQRLLQADEVAGFCAWVDGRLVGITHYLFHANVWPASVVPPACTGAPTTPTPVPGACTIRWATTRVSFCTTTAFPEGSSR